MFIKTFLTVNNNNNIIQDDNILYIRFSIYKKNLYYYIYIKFTFL